MLDSAFPVPAPITPMFVDSKKPKPSYPQVKHPLLYKITKDGKTHHVLGVLHVVPLNYMPQHVLNIIDASSLLISEGIATMPDNFRAIVSDGPMYENFNCTDHLHDDFKKDITKILKLYSIENIDLNSLPLCFLRFLFFQCIFQREVSNKLRIDDKLIKIFKHRDNAYEKNIIELATQEMGEVIDRCIAVEKDLKEQTPDNIQSLFLETCEKINEYYLEPDNRVRNTNFFQQEMTSIFLNEDIHMIDPQYFDRFFDLEEQAVSQEKNFNWLRVFKENHEKHDGMLLACGFAHLITPENSMLRLLEKEGFAVSYVQPPLLDNASPTRQGLSL